MTLDTVPWAIKNGAVHSVEVARTLAYAATGGNSGVTQGTDLAVRALSTPGTSVRVGIGSAAIVNTYAGQSGQTYIARNTSDENVGISAATTARSDMLVLRIDDPQYGGSAPSSVASGPYVKFAIISNVGSTAETVPVGTAYPCIPLARIDIPANTATITQSMIKDLRKIVAPRRQRQILQGAGTGALNAGSGLQIDTAAEPGTVWPVPAGLDVDVPSWATRVNVVCTIFGIFTTGNCSAYFKVRLGAGSSAPSPVFGLTTFFDENQGQAGGTGGGPSRFTHGAALSSTIPGDMRGTTQKIQGRAIANGSPSALVQADAGTITVFDVEFIEEPSLP